MSITIMQQATTRRQSPIPVRWATSFHPPPLSANLTAANRSPLSQLSLRHKQLPARIAPRDSHADLVAHLPE
jgi:hypothetical protein